MKSFLKCLGTVLDWLALHASIVTAVVAGLALWAAIHSIKIQRSTARKRAALDLFFKSEMDKGMIDAFDEFEDSIGLLKQNSSLGMNDFVKSHNKAYRNIRHCLNIHELIAVGIYTGVLDEDVCYEFWGDELMDAARDAKRVIEYTQTSEGGGTPVSYRDLAKLGVQWNERAEKAYAARGVRLPQ